MRLYRSEIPLCLKHRKKLLAVFIVFYDGFAPVELICNEPYHGCPTSRAEFFSKQLLWRLPRCRSLYSPFRPYPDTSTSFFFFFPWSFKGQTWTLLCLKVLFFDSSSFIFTHVQFYFYLAVIYNLKNFFVHELYTWLFKLYTNCSAMIHLNIKITFRKS